MSAFTSKNKEYLLFTLQHFFLINLFIYLWLRWVFIAVHRPSLVAVNGGHSSLQCMGPPLRWPPLPWSTGSRHMGFSSCGTQAQPLRGMWDPPGPGLEPVSPALAGGLPTTVPPGKSQHFYITILF